MSDHLTGMSPRERVMWRVITELASSVGQLESGDGLSSVMLCAEIDLANIAEAEEAEELRLDSMETDA